MSWKLDENWNSLDNWDISGVPTSVSVAGNEVLFSCEHGSQACIAPKNLEYPTVTSAVRGWCLQTDFFVPSGGYSWIDLTNVDQNPTVINDFSPTWGVLKFRTYSGTGDVDTPIAYNTWYTLRIYAVSRVVGEINYAGVDNRTLEWQIHFDVVGVAGAAITHVFGTVYSNPVVPSLRADTYGIDRTIRFKNTQITTVDALAEATAWIAGGSFPSPTCDKPAFSVPAGSVAAGTAVVVSSATAGARLIVTTDGSVPTSPATEAEILDLPTSVTVTIADSVTVNALAVAVGFGASALASASYVAIFKTPTPVIAPASGSYPAPLDVAVTDTATGDVVIVYTVDGSDPTYTGDSFDAGYAAGYGSVRNWTGIANDFDGNYYAASAGDGGSVAGSLWKSADPTGSWTQLTGPGNAGAGAWSDIACGVNGTVFACIPSQTGSVLWRSQDFGAAWEVIIPSSQGWDSLKYLCADSTGNVAYSGPFGIIRSHDSGSTWSGGTSGANNAYGRVVADNDGNWYVTSTGGVRKSTDKGASWALLPGSPVGATPAFAVSGDGSKMVWCAQPANPSDFASLKYIVVSTDSGVTWRNVAYDNNLAPAAFVFAADGAIYGTGDHAAGIGLLASYDNGTTWRSITGPIASTPVLFADEQSRIWGFDNEQYYLPFRYTKGWNGNLYTGSFTLQSGSVTVKAIARKRATNYVNSDIASSDYVISQLRKLFAGLGGVWHEVVAVEAGSNGTWKPASLQAGKDGSWH